MSETDSNESESISLTSSDFSFKNKRDETSEAQRSNKDDKIEGGSEDLFQSTTISRCPSTGTEEDKAEKDEDEEKSKESNFKNYKNS